jgi:flavodoxin/ferredoxin
MAEKIAVVYFSQTGNTGKVAQAIARGLEKSGAQADLMRLEKTDPESLSAYDLVGFGMPVFYYKPPFNVPWFINRMRGMEGKSAFAFLTEGGHASNTFLRLAKQLGLKGMTLVGAFKCLGYDTYPPFIGKDRCLGHPDAQELADAEAFGATLRSKRERIKAGETEHIPVFQKENDRFSRLAVILTRPILYFVSPRKVVNTAKCTRCGECAKNCPTENIDLEPFPKFRRRCIYCYGCERVCPVRAIECDWTRMKKRIEKSYEEKPH